MRIYDARLGRFMSVDPLTGKYPYLTPYQFASNRPIDGVDLDGLEWKSEHKWADAITDKRQIKLLTDAGVYKKGMTYKQAWDAYVPILYQSYVDKGVQLDCADLCYKGVIDFAEMFKLPIFFQGARDNNHDKKFDNDDMVNGQFKYKTKEELTKAVNDAFNSGDLGSDDPNYQHTIARDNFDDVQVGDIISWYHKGDELAHHGQTVVGFWNKKVDYENSDVDGVVSPIIHVLKGAIKMITVIDGNQDHDKPTKAVKRSKSFGGTKFGWETSAVGDRTKARQWNTDNFDKHK